VAYRMLQQAQVSLERLRSDVTGRMSTPAEKLPTSVEVPFSGAAKRTLQFAAAEADRLAHSYIGVEHLLLALLRDETTIAGAALAAQGLRLGAARDMLLSLLDTKTHVSLTKTDVTSQVDAIKKLVMELGATASKVDEMKATMLVAQIVSALDELRPPLPPSPEG
jgi:ATP-dependent Clp protease ATP-binding subunit ClpA